jgi:poly-gamma-glutamate synthesis protein (capsule biosynthesis protein)
MLTVLGLGFIAVGAGLYFGVIGEDETVLVLAQFREIGTKAEKSPAPEIYIEEPDYEYEEDLGCPYTVTILVSAAGDVTLGGDHRWRGYHEFMREFRESGYDHATFFKNVAHIFYESCLSLVNLEGPLTYITTAPQDKEFLFRGPPHFAQILSAGNIDAVSMANNHTRDFGMRGYFDTQEALRDVGVAYFGNDKRLIKYVNGIRVGLFGHSIWADTAENRGRITASIGYLRGAGAQLIIAFMHWGAERENFPRPYQITAGRFTIQAGADLVLGSHPHVIQGIEEHNGRYIVYSLADFSFGGNAAPSDQHAFIFQQTFTFYRGELLPYNDTNIIPVFMSSVRGRNDFRPTPAEYPHNERILARIKRYSEPLG